MASRSSTQVFPRRDADGRVISLAELLAAAFGGTLLGLCALALIDGVFAIIGFGTFGRGSGWLAAVLPAFLFFDDFRAWRGGGGVRIVVAIMAAAASVTLGLVAAAVVSGLPPILSGAVGATVAALVYSFVWFVGIRWLTGRRTDVESR